MKKVQLKFVSVMVAVAVGVTPIASMAFGLGQANHHLEIGRPLSIRIPLGSVTGEFSPSCVVLNKSEDDQAGANFPVGMRVSMIPGEQPTLLISGPVVKQPIVEFTLVSNCPNTKYERTYQLLPDASTSDRAAAEQEEPITALASDETETVSPPPVSRTLAKPRVQSGLKLRMEESIDTRKHTYPQRQVSNSGSREMSQKFDKMRLDIDAATSSLNRLSDVATGQMDVQLKLARELSRVSALVVEHDEKIAVMDGKLMKISNTVSRHDERLSHWMSDSLINAFGGGLLGFCFSAAGLFLYDRKRSYSSGQSVTSTGDATITASASAIADINRETSLAKPPPKFYCTCGKAFRFANGTVQT